MTFQSCPKLPVVTFAVDDALKLTLRSEVYERVFVSFMIQP